MWTVYNEVKKDSFIRWFNLSDSEAKKRSAEACKVVEREVLRDWDNFMSSECKDSDVENMFQFFYAFCWNWHDMTNIEMRGLDDIFRAFFTEDMSHNTFKVFSYAYFRHAPIEAICDCIFYALDKVHEDWIRHNGRRLIDGKYKDKMYMFLPLEYFGTGRANGVDKFKDITADYIFGKAILEAFGITVGYTTLRNVYKKKYHVEFERGGVCNILLNYLDSLALDYPYKRDMLKFCKNPKVGKVVYEQIYGKEGK